MELSHMYGYPDKGGSSGVVCKNVFRAFLKRLRVVKRVKVGGRAYQNLAAFITKLLSYLVKSFPCITFHLILVVA